MQESTTDNMNQASQKAMGVIGDLISRAKPIILNPKAAWVEINNRNETTKDFYKNYLIYMAAIAPICALISMSMFGILSFSMNLKMQIVAYGLALLMPFISSLIFPKIASMCQGEMTANNAMRLTGYAATITYIGGFLQLVPLLSILSIFLAIYAVYTFYVGVPRISTIPESQVLKFTALAVVAWIIISIIITSITAVLFIGSMAAEAGMGGLGVGA